MARVVLVGNLAQLTGGVAEFELSATSVKQLYQQLTELHPAIGPHLETGVAVAIDGQIFQDTLLEPIGPDSEVFLLPQIAGGSVLAAQPRPNRFEHADATRAGKPVARSWGHDREPAAWHTAIQPDGLHPLHRQAIRQR